MTRIAAVCFTATVAVLWAPWIAVAGAAAYLGWLASTERP